MFSRPLPPLPRQRARVVQGLDRHLWGPNCVVTARQHTQRPVHCMATLGALPVAVVAAQAKCWAAAAAATAFVPPVCFDAECAAGADAAFLTAVSLPLVAALAVGAWVLRPPPKELLDSGRLFEDPKTGTMFEAPEGVSPEVDKNVSLADEWQPHQRFRNPTVCLSAVSGTDASAAGHLPRLRFQQPLPPQAANLGVSHAGQTAGSRHERARRGIGSSTWRHCPLS
jgi:hypothetical protein